MKLLKISLLSTIAFSLLSACQTPTQTHIQQPLQPRVNSFNNQSNPEFFGTAKRNLYSANAEARKWDSGAYLVKVESRFLTSDGRNGMWYYYYKATGNRKVLKVENYGKSRETNQYVSGLRIYDFSWKIDSDDVAKLIQDDQGDEDIRLYDMELNHREWKVRTSKGRFYVDMRSGDVSLR